MNNSLEEHLLLPRDVYRNLDVVVIAGGQLGGQMPLDFRLD